MRGDQHHQGKYIIYTFFSNSRRGDRVKNLSTTIIVPFKVIEYFEKYKKPSEYKDRFNV